MSKYKRIWINTKIVWQWDEKTQRLVEIKKEGYWWEGPVAYLMGDPNFVQSAFAGFEDDAALGSATQIGTNNTSWNQNVDETFRVRFEISETAGNAANNRAYTVYYSTDDTSYSECTTTSAVKLVTSAFVTDGTTISTANDHFGNLVINGEFDSDNNVSNITLTNQTTEMEYCLQIDSASITSGTVYLKVYESDRAFDATSGSYTNRPALTVVSPVTVNATPSATGTSTLTKKVGKKPNISATGSSALVIGPRVWLNTSQSLTGATQMTVTSYNEAGTSITFTDPVGAPTGSNLWLGVERADGEVGWIQVTVNAPDNTVNLPAGTLDLADFDPQVTATENRISSLDAETIDLTSYAPQVTSSDSQTSNLPAETLDLADFDPQATTTENKVSKLPVEKATLDLADFDPQAITTEKNTSLLAAASLAFVAFAPQITSTENTTVELPAETFTLTNYGITTSYTEKRVSLLPGKLGGKGQLEITNNAPTITTTENRVALLDAETLVITTYDPEAQTTEAGSNTSNLPVDTLTVTGNDPQSITTEKNISDLPVDTLTVTNHSPEIGTTENNISDLPVDTLTVTGHDPEALTSEGEISNLPTAALSLADFDPQTVITENNISDLPVDTLTVTDYDPSVTATENRISQLDAETIVVTGFDPQAITTEVTANQSDLPPKTLTVTGFDPQITTTEKNIVSLESETIVLTAYAIDAIAGEPPDRLIIVT